MNVLILISFLLLLFGLFFVFKISLFDIGRDASVLFRRKKRIETLHAKIKNALGMKKKRSIQSLISETKEILKVTNKESKLSLICVYSFVLMAMGIFVALIMSNVLLVPILGVGFSLLPFWYVRFTSTKWKKELNNELETALSVITTSYMRSESIITAIDENVGYLNPTVHDVFKAFLTQTKLINSNIKLALVSLKFKIDNAVFHEWVDAVIDCQENKNLKFTLPAIVSKLSDVRIVSAELEYLLYKPVTEFITMVILLVANIPLMYFLNRDWFNSLMFTSIGNVILAFCALVIFISIPAVIKLSKPVEYKR
ncbi:MAG: type II secretion system F family protein [Alkaliphilus sp.]